MFRTPSIRPKEDLSKFEDVVVQFKDGQFGVPGWITDLLGGPVAFSPALRTEAEEVTFQEFQDSFMQMVVTSNLQLFEKAFVEEHLGNLRRDIDGQTRFMASATKWRNARFGTQWKP